MFQKLTIVASLLSLIASSSGAETIHIDTLMALDLSESNYGKDRIRIEYIVDGGKMRAIYRDMRYGDVWNVDFDIHFEREVVIQLYEKEKWIAKDKKLGAFKFQKGSLSQGDATELNFTGKGGRYWMSVGSGPYLAPKLPDAPPPLPQQERWEYAGGVYESSETASAAGAKMVEAGLAKKFDVYSTVNFLTNRLEWRIKYVLR